MEENKGELIIEYPIGEIVYLVTDPDQYDRIVRRLIIDAYGIMYELACGDLITTHYAYEMTAVKNVANL